MIIKLSALNIFMLLIMVSFNSHALPKLEMIEDAIEGKPSVLFIARDLTGHLKARKCEDCQEIKITITPKTKAYIGQQAVSLKSMAAKTAKPELIFYDIKTKKATRLYWPGK